MMPTVRSSTLFVEALVRLSIIIETLQLSQDLEFKMKTLVKSGMDLTQNK